MGSLERVTGWGEDAPAHVRGPRARWRAIVSAAEGACRHTSSADTARARTPVLLCGLAENGKALFRIEVIDHEWAGAAFARASTGRMNGGEVRGRLAEEDFGGRGAT